MKREGVGNGKFERDRAIDRQSGGDRDINKDGN
jgi:hypothetical protein